jgi:hypothetical protein
VIDVSGIDTQFEEVERALILAVRTHIESALIEVATDMIAKDLAYYGALGLEVPETPLEVPALYLTGHHPFLLDKPIEDFPNVVTNATQTIDSQDDWDQGQLVPVSVYLEAFVAARDDPDDLTYGSDATNRIVKRYAKALNRCVWKDQTLGGLTERVSSMGDVQVSNSTARRIDDLHSDLVYLRGCRISYTFTVPQGPTY